MKRIFLKIDTEKWFANRKSRLCSPAARGFLVDLMALCAPEGYLLDNGNPLSDDQIAGLCGCKISNLRIWMKELGDAGLFGVDDRGLFFPDMVAAASAKEKRDSEKKKPSPKPQRERIQIEKVTTPEKIGGYVSSEILSAGYEIVGRELEKMTILQPQKSKDPALPWFRSPAGWVREGQKQGLSMGVDEHIDAFKLRVSMRLGEGIHLEHVPPSVAAAVRAKIAKESEMMKKA